MKRVHLMNNDTFITTYHTCIMGVCSWIIAHLPEIQAFITFCLTIVFLIYKIREARAKAIHAEKENSD